MKTNHRLQGRNRIVAAVFALSTLAFFSPLPAQENPDKDKRESQPERDGARPQQEERRDQGRRPAPGSEVRPQAARGREMVQLEERLQALGRRIDELNQRLDGLSQMRGQALRLRQGRFMRPGNFAGGGGGEFRNSPGPFNGGGGGQFLNPGPGQGPVAPQRPQAPQPPGMPGPAGERQGRLEHLKIAIENLHAAGMHEPAERLAQELQRLANQPGPGNSLENRGPGGGPGMEQLRAELQELRQANQELRRKLEDRERERR